MRVRNAPFDADANRCSGINNDINAAIESGNPSATLNLPRFTDAGYECLTVQLDPSTGLPWLPSLAYK